VLSATEAKECNGMILLNFLKVGFKQWAIQTRGYYTDNAQTFREMRPAVEDLLKNDFSKVLTEE